LSSKKVVLLALSLILVVAVFIFNSSMASLQFFLDPLALIQWGGVIGIALIIFAETGLLFGFFLPGDSLLITAGILSSRGYLDLRWLILLSVVAAIAGDQFNYTMGLRGGEYLAKRYARFRVYLEKAKLFYDKYGGKAITLARFVPVIRTFAPAVAGATKMRYRDFIIYNVVGGVSWPLITILLGYVLGSTIPQIDQYLILVIAVVVLASFLPTLIELARTRSKRKQDLGVSKNQI